MDGLFQPLQMLYTRHSCTWITHPPYHRTSYHSCMCECPVSCKELCERVINLMNVYEVRITNRNVSFPLHFIFWVYIYLV